LDILFNVLKNYLVINKINDVVEIKRDINLSGPSLNSKVFQDKRIIVSVKYEMANIEDRPESIWVYDLVKKIKSKKLDIPVGETVLTCGYDCYLNTDLITLQNNVLTIKTHIKDFSYDPSDTTTPAAAPKSANEYKINL